MDNEAMKTVRLPLVPVLAVILILNTALLFADDSTPPPAPDQQRWAIMPVLGYNAEMGFIMGVLGTHFLTIDPDEVHPSSIDCYIIGTSKKQYELNFFPNLYFGDGAYHFEAHFIPRIWKANFYGIGIDPLDEGEPYELDNFETTASFEWFFKKYLFAGVEYRYLWEDLTPDAGGLLETSGIDGFEGGKVAGLGGSFGFDSRDNRNDTRNGWFAKYNALAYRSALGSDFEYNTSTIDVRRFLSLPHNSGLALGGYARFGTGTIPFRELSSPDGVEKLRGIENGLFRDNHLLALQVEYRKTFNRRFGMTFFTETAEVAHEAADFDGEGLVTSTGIGFRVGLNPEQKFNLRIDISAVNGGMGFVIFIREAF